VIRLKLKGGALQLSMFIMIVIALLLTSFILLIHVHKQFNIKTDFVIETINNANKGINYALNNSIELKDTISVTLNDQDYRSLQVYRDYWGLFEKVSSRSNVKNKTSQKIALIGATQPEINRMALYVEDNNKPLVLVGNTKIEGLAYLPKRGVKTGNISGHSYFGTQLIYGQTELATELPGLFKEISNNINEITNQITTLKTKTGRINLLSGDNYTNSFSNPFQYVFNSEVITLRDVKVIGHFIIQSKAKIVVYPSARLKDVILIAPEIEIRNSVNGTFQCFATRIIKVGKNCELSYPSALILNENSTFKTQSSNLSTQQVKGITINENSTIKGVIVFQGQTKSKNYKAQVFLENNSKVIGEVYCNQNLELKGSVTGTVFTSNFVANQAGSIYQNHIYNGTININKLPQEYVGLMFDNTKKKGLMKWLY